MARRPPLVSAHAAEGRHNSDVAADSCQETYDGGDLASIHSEDENREALRACIEVAADGDAELQTGVALGHFCWIGFNDAAREGTFVWSDGSESDYTNWNQIDYHNDQGGGCGPEPNNCGDRNIEGGGACRDATRPSCIDDSPHRVFQNHT